MKDFPKRGDSKERTVLQVMRTLVNVLYRIGALCRR